MCEGEGEGEEAGEGPLVGPLPAPNPTPEELFPLALLAFGLAAASVGDVGTLIGTAEAAEGAGDGGPVTREPEDRCGLGGGSLPDILLFLLLLSSSSSSSWMSFVCFFLFL